MRHHSPEGPPRRLARTLFDRRRYFDPAARLGAIYTPAETAFRVFAPTAEQVSVLIAEQASGSQGTQRYPMTLEKKGIWQARVKGNLAGRFYAYQLAGPGFDADREVADIYAVCARWDADRALIVDLRATDPTGWQDSRWQRPASPVDAVIYEMHVRDFTIGATSGAEKPGTYAALTERGTHLPGRADIATGIDHLREMGVTHVQLMPVQEFDPRNVENDHLYNWGYMPVHFNSPNGWLAGQCDGDFKIRELKRAIHTLHHADLGVVLDVVYNHTSLLASFERLVPGYYYRRHGSGRLANGSGCGNEFRSESPMARKFILDSLRFWVEEYQVDGFRFDLMSLIDIETMRQIRAELSAIDPGILIYGEPWAAGRSPLRKQSTKARIRGMGIGAFNDAFRDGIKGNLDDATPGFVQTGERLDRIAEGLLGCSEDWPIGPAETINYFECHDNLTAWDKLLRSSPDADDDQRRRMMRLGALILFTAQGIPFIQAGQEFCRYKGGFHNSYNLPDEVNQVDWSLKLTHDSVWRYFKGMIALRKHHPVLRLRDAESARKRMSLTLLSGGRSLCCCWDGQGLTGEPAEMILLLLNGEEAELQFELPPGAWQVHVDADRACIQPMYAVHGEAAVPGRSGMLMMR